MRWFAILIALVGCRLRFGEESDARLGDAELPHIQTAPGWSVRVFADFSESFTYASADFIDGPDTYANMPIGLFVLRAPYSEALAVIAGREILEVTASSVVSHDLGNHPPNTLANPDELTDGAWTSTFNAGNPAVLLTSSSDAGGDGLFQVSTQWMTSNLSNQNNTRTFAWDEAGSFDARGTPETYLGTGGAIVRRSDGVMILTGDTVSLKLLGSELLIVRRIAVDTDERLIRVSSMTAGMYPEVQLAQAGRIAIGDGAPPAPAIGWAVLGGTELAAVNATGAPTVIATTDADNQWQDAATPPAGHTLATAENIVYVLETNRALDRDRVLMFTSP